ncbi:MAG: RICIN domain-containing protein [Acidobacteriota bacterium]
MSYKNFRHRLTFVLCACFTLVATHGHAQQAYKFELKQSYIQFTTGPFCMDVEHNSSSSGENVEVDGCDQGESQIWDLVPVAGSTYSKLVARHSGLCLDVKGASTRKGRNIQQYGCHGGDNQLWKIEYRGGGYAWLKNKNSNLCAKTVTSVGFPPKQLRILEQDTCSDSDDRLWEVITSFCGNNYCGDFLENCTSCARDCGACPPVCGNLVCESGESCSSCSTDCGVCASCPNGLCEPGESCSSCASDCGLCSSCGNGICELGEDCNTCPFDCPSLGGLFEDDECPLQ